MKFLLKYISGVVVAYLIAGIIFALIFPSATIGASIVSVFVWPIFLLAFVLAFGWN